MTLPDLGDAIAAAWGALAALVLGGLLVAAVLGSCIRGGRRAWRVLSRD